MMSLMRSDASLKLASLVLAIFVWAYVRSEAKPLQIFSVPLEIEGLPPDVAVAGDVLDSVAVRVRAPDTTLRNLTPGRFRALVKLNNVRQGEVTIPLGNEIIRAPLGVEVVRVDPRLLTLSIESRVAREVPVVARITGEPAEGFEYDGYTLSPDVVTVEGPQSVMDQVTQAIADQVSIEGRSKGFEAVVRLAPDRSGARVSGNSNAVLSVNIRPQRVTQVYAGVKLEPVLPAGSRLGISYRPESVSVVLEGTRETLNAITSGNIRALLDLEGMGPREAPYSVKPRVVITPGDLGSAVAVQSISHPTVNVTISR